MKKVKKKRLKSLNDLEQREVGALVPTVEEILNDPTLQGKLPELSPHLRKFAFDYLTTFRYKTHIEWAREYGVHVRTLEDWTYRKDFKLYVKIVQSRLNLYLEESLKVIARETMDKWREMISQPITEDNLDTMRKIIFEGIELLRGHLPQIENIDDQDEDDYKDVSIPELKRRIAEFEFIDGLIDEDEEGETEKRSTRNLKTRKDL